MLGEQIGQETGKVTGFHVLDSASVKAEISITGTGKILGIDYRGRAMRGLLPFGREINVSGPSRQEVAAAHGAAPH